MSQHYKLVIRLPRSYGSYKAYDMKGNQFSFDCVTYGSRYKTDRVHIYHSAPVDCTVIVYDATDTAMFTGNARAWSWIKGDSEEEDDFWEDWQEDFEDSLQGFKEPVCECGALYDLVPIHSEWCPLYDPLGDE